MSITPTAGAVIPVPVLLPLTAGDSPYTVDFLSDARVRAITNYAKTHEGLYHGVLTAQQAKALLHNKSNIFVVKVSQAALTENPQIPVGGVAYLVWSAEPCSKLLKLITTDQAVKTLKIWLNYRRYDEVFCHPAWCESLPHRM